MAEARSGRLLFVSYADEDIRVVERICGLLEKQGHRCWRARRDNRAGHHWGAEIIAAIERSDGLVLVLTTHANASKYVPLEVERARSKGRPIYPLLLQNIAPAPEIELFISATHWIEAWDGRLEEHVARLAASVGEDTPLRHPIQRPTGSRRNAMLALAVVLLAAAGGIGAYALGVFGDVAKRSAGNSGTSGERISTENVLPASTPTEVASPPAASGEPTGVDALPAASEEPTEMTSSPAATFPSSEASSPNASVPPSEVASLPAAPDPPAEAAAVGERHKVILPPVRVFDGTGIVRKPIAELRFGDEVVVLPHDDRRWRKVQLSDGRIGFVEWSDRVSPLQALR